MQWVTYRPFGLRSLTYVLVVVLAVLGVSSRALGESPPVDQPAPRVIRVESAPGPVSLTDVNGREIPLTGPQVAPNGSELAVYPPRLPVGTYTLEYPSGSYTFQVGNPPVPIGTTGKHVWWWILVGSSAVPAAWLLYRRRWPLACVLLLLPATVLVVSLDSPKQDVRRQNPCPTAGTFSAGLETCAKQYILDVAAAQGLSTAYVELERLAASDRSWSQSCHEAAHALGSRAWLESADVDETLSIGGSVCSLGYVHGVLETMGSYSSDADFSLPAHAVCLSLSDNAPSAQAQPASATVLGCYHGLGHASMWRHNENLSSALAVCAEAIDIAAQDECRAGAVMAWVYAEENATKLGREDLLPDPRVANPLELCQPPLGELTPGCVEGAVMAISAGQVDSTLRWCANAASVTTACVRSVARRAVQMELTGQTGTLTQAAKLCSEVGGAVKEQGCVMELGYMLMFLGRDHGRTQSFCSALTPAQRSSCLEGIEAVRVYAETTGDSSFNFGASD